MTITLSELAPLAWAALAISAVLVGLSKTAIPGINTLSIAAFAAFLPAKASTGALLMLLIVGDIFALWTYRRHADIPTLIRLIPAVIVGVALGGVFLAVASDGWVRRGIGVILILIIAFTLWQRTRSTAAAGPVARSAYGGLGGFTTMVANAGGPVMSMYFLAARFPVKAFLGTAAWFFAVINLIKVPISAGLGLITLDTLGLTAILAPGVVIGALVGRWIANRIKQDVFDWAVIICTIIGALYLLLG